MSTLEKKTSRKYHDMMRALIAGALSSILVFSGVTPVLSATPAQVPLLTRSNNAVEPNVMFTFDDSGSMAWRFMPDNAPSWTTNNNVRWSLVFHPSDNLSFGNGDGTWRLVATRPNRRTGGDQSICETDTQHGDCRASDLVSARMRSSAWNTVYYNPEIRYQPWYEDDGTPFPDSLPDAAWLNPNDRASGGTVDLVGEQTTTANTIWCRSANNDVPNTTTTGDRNRTAARCATISATQTPIYANETFAINSGTCPNLGSGWSWSNSACGRTANNSSSCTSAGGNWGSSGQNPRCRLTSINESHCSNIGGLWQNSQCFKPVEFGIDQGNCPAFGSGWSWINNACGRTANNSSSCTNAGGTWGSSGQNPRCSLTSINQSLCNNIGGLWQNSTCLQADTNTEHFIPAVYYHHHGGSTSDATNFSRVRIMDLPATGIARGPGRTDCTVSGEGRSCSRDQEYQNFANWFTYYRTRNYLAIAAASRAFSEQPENLRIGYARINKSTSTIDGTSNTRTVQRGVRRFAGSEREEFFTWLHGVPASGGTPLRQAMDDVGQYFSRADNRGPWANTPGTDDGSATTAHLQCRKSYHLLMSDGYWNGNAATVATGNVDNTQGPLITGPSGNSFRYNAARPYLDSHSGTLADAAMYYWNRDLRPNLPNRVPPDASNPAFWQHMVNFTVGLGVGGSLAFPADLASIQAGTLNWPQPAADTATAVDDMWHAAVNSRGRYLSADNPDEFASALSSILSEIIVRSGSEAGVAGAAATLQVGNRKYIPTYQTGVWNGNVTAYGLDPFGQQLDEIWNAENALPTPGQRNILVGTRNGPSAKAVAFNWSTLNANPSLLNELGPGVNEGLVNYLRGVRTGEGSTYRARSGVLGDFVNSQPVFVKGLVDMRYDTLPQALADQRSTYRAFVNQKRARTGVVFIGGNAGMLHAFSDTNGQEIFAFIPRILLPGLSALASSSYGHRYYVDGQFTESDAWINGGWKNVLVGSAGAGQRAVFALDVTSTSSMGAGNVLWELDSTIESELGHVLAPIEIGLLKNGQWAAVFGNGYDSASGRARLFIVNLQNGTVIKQIPVGPNNDGNNGLGGVRLVRDGNQYIVGAYAGDLKGKAWKFDLSSSDTDNWRVSFSGNPLFDAGAERPITAAPQVIAHPNGGYVVLIGTGKLFEEGDELSTSGQSLYGLWDKQSIVVASGSSTWKLAEGEVLIAPITASDSLAEHRLEVASGIGSGDSTYYTIESQEVDWATQRGWTLPLDAVAGQRNLLSAQFAFGYALFETMAPSDTGEVNPCDTSNAGVSFNLLLNPLTGKMPSRPIFDVDGDGIVNTDPNEGDPIVAGIKGAWDGRDVILTEPPCTTPLACPIPDDDEEERCEPGSKLVSMQGAVGGATNVCVPVPGPERWWWRQIQ